MRLEKSFWIISGDLLCQLYKFKAHYTVKYTKYVYMNIMHYLKFYSHIIK